MLRSEGLKRERESRRVNGVHQRICEQERIRSNERKRGETQKMRDGNTSQADGVDVGEKEAGHEREKLSLA